METAFPISARYGSKLSKDGVQSLALRYSSQQPFPHGTLDGLLDGDFLKSVLSEIQVTAEFDEKNSDLYEKYQTVNDINEKTMPKLHELRTALASKEMRQLLSSITGRDIPPESQFDCHVHAYGQGHHLMCHDDAVSSRSIAFILYLNPEWDGSTDGGRLELYPRKWYVAGDNEYLEPTETPSVRVEPSFNRFAFFGVTKDLSWHAVEEIRTDQRPRVSIQGWYHSNEEQSLTNLDTAETLDVATEIDDFYMRGAREVPKFEPSSDGLWDATCLSKCEVDYLEQLGVRRDLIHNREVVGQMREDFFKTGVLVISDFLKPEVIPDISIWESEGMIQGPPSIFRYERYCDPTGCGHPLNKLRYGLFALPVFLKLIAEFTGLSSMWVKTELRRFKKGRDYTLAIAPSHGDRLTVSWIHSKGEEEDGGSDFLVPAGDVGNHESARDGEFVEIGAKPNDLVFVLRPLETPCVHFIKYIKDRATCDRIDISLHIVPRVDGSDEESGEG